MEETIAPPLFSVPNSIEELKFDNYQNAVSLDPPKNSLNPYREYRDVPFKLERQQLYYDPPEPPPLNIANPFQDFVEPEEGCDPEGFDYQVTSLFLNISFVFEIPFFSNK